MLAADQESKNHSIAKDGEIGKTVSSLKLIRLALLALFFSCRQSHRKLQSVYVLCRFLLGRLLNGGDFSCCESRVYGHSTGAYINVTENSTYAALQFYICLKALGINIKMLLRTFWVNK